MAGFSTSIALINTARSRSHVLTSIATTNTRQEALLEAEVLAMNGAKMEEVVEKYRAAAVVSARSGFVHDAALVNERHAEYMLECCDRKEASFLLRKAIELYEEWGAETKVSHLKQKYRDVLSQ